MKILKEMAKGVSKKPFLNEVYNVIKNIRGVQEIDGRSTVIYVAGGTYNETLEFSTGSTDWKRCFQQNPEMQKRKPNAPYTKMVIFTECLLNE